MSIRNENINALFLFRETGRDLLRQRVKYIARNASPHTNRLVCVLVQLIKVTSIIQFIIVKLQKRQHIHRHFQKWSKIRLILHMYNKSWCVLWSLMLFLETFSLSCVFFELICPGIWGRVLINRVSEASASSTIMYFSPAWPGPRLKVVGSNDSCQYGLCDTCIARPAPTSFCLLVQPNILISFMAWMLS